MFKSIAPLLPMASLASASGGIRFSALIIAGLMLSALALWRTRNLISVQLMPVIALSVVAYGMEVKTAILTGAFAGFALLVLSFSPWLIPLLRIVPANVVSGMNAAIAALILERGLAAFRGVVQLREISVGSVLTLALWVAVVVSALALVVRGRTATALAGIFVLTAIATPAIFLRIEPDLSLHLSFPALNSLKTTAFPYLLPEFFYAGIAAVVAGARLQPDSRSSASPDEVAAARIAGSLATLAACPMGFIPAIPATTPHRGPSPAARNSPRIIVPALIAIASVIALSGLIDALPNHFPAFVIPGLCVLAAWPFLDALRTTTHPNDRVVALATTVIVFATRSFGWGFIGGIVTAALFRMVRGETPLSLPVQELRNL